MAQAQKVTSTKVTKAAPAVQPTDDVRSDAQKALALLEATDPTMSKSAKIRTLFGQGFTKGDIARALNIKYQHVRNVLITPLKRPETVTE